MEGTLLAEELPSLPSSQDSVSVASPDYSPSVTPTLSLSENDFSDDPDDDMSGPLTVDEINSIDDPIEPLPLPDGAETAEHFHEDTPENVSFPQPPPPPPPPLPQCNATSEEEEGNSSVTGDETVSYVSSSSENDPEDDIPIKKRMADLFGASHAEKCGYSHPVDDPPPAVDVPMAVPTQGSFRKPNFGGFKKITKRPRTHTQDPVAFLEANASKFKRKMTKIRIAKPDIDINAEWRTKTKVEERMRKSADLLAGTLENIKIEKKKAVKKAKRRFSEEKREDAESYALSLFNIGRAFDKLKGAGPFQLKNWIESAANLTDVKSTASTAIYIQIFKNEDQLRSVVRRIKDWSVMPCSLEGYKALLSAIQSQQMNIETVSKSEVANIVIGKKKQLARRQRNLRDKGKVSNEDLTDGSSFEIFSKIYKNKLSKAKFEKMFEDGQRSTGYLHYPTVLTDAAKFGAVFLKAQHTDKDESVLLPTLERDYPHLVESGWLGTDWDSLKPEIKTLIRMLCAETKLLRAALWSKLKLKKNSKMSEFMPSLQTVSSDPAPTTPNSTKKRPRDESGEHMSQPPQKKQKLNLDISEGDSGLYQREDGMWIAGTISKIEGTTVTIRHISGLFRTQFNIADVKSGASWASGERAEKYRKDTDDKIRQILCDEGYSAVRNGGGGDCLPLSIAEKVPGKTLGQIRADICKALDQYGSEIPEDMTNRNEEFWKDRAWGGNTEIWGAAHAYNLRISVWVVNWTKMKLKELDHFGKEDSEPFGIFYHERFGHYEALKRVEAH